MQFFLRANENLVRGNIAPNLAEGALQGFVLGNLMAVIRSELVNTFETPGTQILLITVPILLGAVLGIVKNCCNTDDHHVGRANLNP